jgi:hypothetical protein
MPAKIVLSTQQTHFSFFLAFPSNIPNILAALVQMAAKKTKGTSGKKAKPVRTKSDPLLKDLPKGWKAHEESVEEEKESKPRLSNNVLWLLFAVVLVFFIALPFLAQPAQEELQETYVNGIRISAPGDPVAYIQSLSSARIEGKRLDNLDDSHSALNELLVVLGGESSYASSSYTLMAGVTGETGITITSNTITIEGKDRRDFWNAVWTFTSLFSRMDIDSSIDLYSIQNMPVGRSEVYLVQQQDGACPNYARIISAEGDIIPPLFRSHELDKSAFHYYLSEGVCSRATNQSPVACPEPDELTLVLTMRPGEDNRIIVKNHEIIFEYADCRTVDKISTILGDLLYPNRISALAKMPGIVF